MSEKIRVGLIGYGFAGRIFHAPFVDAVDGLELAAVVERRTAHSKDKYPGVNVVNDVRHLYEDPSIDLIIVTTPSTDHYAFVKDALLAGKHVVVEKPFTPTSAEADELIALAKEQGKVLSVYHNRRYDGDYLTVKELLRQGMIGEVRDCTFSWDGFDPVMRSTNWREGAQPGTGVFYDLGVHLFDQALTLFGIPDAVNGDVRVQREGAEAHDFFDVTLFYGNQMKVRVKSSKFVREASPRYVLHGTEGSFVKYGTDPQEAALIGGAMPGDRGFGIEPRENWGKLNSSIGSMHFEGVVETFHSSYKGYYDNIYKHITGQAELNVKPEEARNAIRLIELALQSSEEGRTLPVKL
ncbi:oxidoreductase [Paenibacillus lignilyticus]|uniref:Oxidoreductase n=1 Tax=Paenibacillus lignilyticus TaxID=1172615 RepID=A0ABS5CFS9_9BACL|nr:oxidoreductase [Paenibacillus lignilyticus]MBP3964703.1 oxidoreductase [Paenibacillus lignilyticus]